VRGRRPRLKGLAKSIVKEVSRVVSTFNDASADGLCDMILSSRRVYLAGMGRSALVGSAFAMRLVHLGFEAHVVGEMTAPAVGTGDLLIAASCTGRTRTTVAQATAARSAGAKLIALTSSHKSNLAKAADLVVRIRAPKDSAQFGGTLFEQGLFIYLDAIVLLLGTRLGTKGKELWSRHSNLE